MRKLFRLIWEGLFPQLSFFKKLLSKKGRKDLEVEEIEQKVKSAVIAQELKKAVLRKEILRHFNKQSGIFKSKFIQPKGKSKHHIQVECERLFGEEMKKINLKLTDDLELV